MITKSRMLAAIAALLWALPSPALAANRTEWTSGNGQGLGWSSRTTAFGTADLTSLASGDSVLSSAAAIANGSNLDQYLDISVEITVGSSTPTTGAYIAISTNTYAGALGSPTFDRMVFFGRGDGGESLFGGGLVACFLWNTILPTQRIFDMLLNPLGLLSFPSDKIIDAGKQIIQSIGGGRRAL